MSRCDYHALVLAISLFPSLLLFLLHTVLGTIAHSVFFFYFVDGRKRYDARGRGGLSIQITCPLYVITRLVVFTMIIKVLYFDGSKFVAS
jgi:hypothetical protein